MRQRQPVPKPNCTKTKIATTQTRSHGVELSKTRIDMQLEIISVQSNGWRSPLQDAPSRSSKIQLSLQRCDPVSRYFSCQVPKMDFQGLQSLRTQPSSTLNSNVQSPKLQFSIQSSNPVSKVTAHSSDPSIAKYSRCIFNASSHQVLNRQVHNFPVLCLESFKSVFKAPIQSSKL